MYIYIYPYIHMSVYKCVCVCLCVYSWRSLNRMLIYVWFVMTVENCDYQRRLWIVVNYEHCTIEIYGTICMVPVLLFLHWRISWAKQTSRRLIMWETCEASLRSERDSKVCISFRRLQSLVPVWLMLFFEFKNYTFLRYCIYYHELLFVVLLHCKNI